MLQRIAFSLAASRSRVHIRKRWWRTRVYSNHLRLKAIQKLPTLYELFTIAWRWYIGTWMGSGIFLYVGTQTDLFGKEIAEWQRMILWAIAIVGLLIAPLIAFDKVRQERDIARKKLNDKRKELEPVRHDIDCLRDTRKSVAEFFETRENLGCDVAATGLICMVFDAMKHGLFRSPELTSERASFDHLRHSEWAAFFLLRTEMAHSRDKPKVSQISIEHVKEFRGWLIEDIDKSIHYLEAKLAD